MPHFGNHCSTAQHCGTWYCSAAAGRDTAETWYTLNIWAWLRGHTGHTLLVIYIPCKWGTWIILWLKCYTLPYCRCVFVPSLAVGGCCCIRSFPGRKERYSPRCPPPRSPGGPATGPPRGAAQEVGAGLSRGTNIKTCSVFSYSHFTSGFCFHDISLFRFSSAQN